MLQMVKDSICRRNRSCFGSDGVSEPVRTDGFYRGWRGARAVWQGAYLSRRPSARAPRRCGRRDSAIWASPRIAIAKIANNLTAARPGPNRTRLTRNARFTERRMLKTERSIAAVLAEAFGLKLSEHDGLTALTNVEHRRTRGPPRRRARERLSRCIYRQDKRPGLTPANCRGAAEVWRVPIRWQPSWAGGPARGL